MKYALPLLIELDFQPFSFTEKFYPFAEEYNYSQYKSDEADEENEEAEEGDEEPEEDEKKTTEEGGEIPSENPNKIVIRLIYFASLSHTYS